MNEIQQEFLEIVPRCRTHLEYQKALGVTVVESLAVPASAGAPVTQPVPKPVKAAELAAPNPVKQKPQAAVLPIPSGTLAAVREELGECTRCKLSKGRKTIVFGEGNPDARLVLSARGRGRKRTSRGGPLSAPRASC